MSNEKEIERRVDMAIVIDHTKKNTENIEKILDILQNGLTTEVKLNSLRIKQILAWMLILTGGFLYGKFGV